MLVAKSLLCDLGSIYFRPILYFNKVVSFHKSSLIYLRLNNYTARTYYALTHLPTVRLTASEVTLSDVAVLLTIHRYIPSSFSTTAAIM